MYRETNQIKIENKRYCHSVALLLAYPGVTTTCEYIFINEPFIVTNNSL